MSQGADDYLTKPFDLTELQAGHPVSETAYLVGFEHPTNFATAFKEVYQLTPTEFVTATVNR